MLRRAPTRPTIRRLGRAALLPFAALVVHQLRFALAVDGNAGAEVAGQGHSYLHSPRVIRLDSPGSLAAPHGSTRRYSASRR
jgi:hypothetical protein